MNVLFACAEVAPFSKVGGLGDVAGALPAALARLGVNIQVISPLYRSVKKSGVQLRRGKTAGPVSLGAQTHPYRLFHFHPDDHSGITYTFVQNDFFYNREGIYTRRNGNGYEDNIARYVFFQKVIADLLSTRAVAVDLLHLQDHHTALLPLLLSGTSLRLPALLTVHNMQYQGILSETELTLLDAHTRERLREIPCGRENGGNSLAAGLLTAQHVNTVSPTYARELLTVPELSFGLYRLLQQIRERFSGILNGVAYEFWNPATDPHLASPYTRRSPGKKLVNKKDLVVRCGLPFASRTPVLGSVSRLVESKGFNLILEIVPELVKLGCQLVFLGTGEKRYVSALSGFRKRYPRQVAYYRDFNEPLAHRIEAGADLFLMPSRFEPCGLNQMYSLKYGTIPVVYRTGGLADTVQEWDGKKGNGFVFSGYGSREFLETIRAALRVFADEKTWQILIRNAMQADYSWKNSARNYLNLYRALVQERNADGY